MLLQIGGVIDIQGFHIKNKFIPRQIAIITKDTIVKVIDFKTGINYNELPVYDRRSVKQVQREIHFLDFEPSPFVKAAPHAEEYVTVLRQLALDYNITSENPLAVNNPQAEILLTEASVPYIAIRTLVPNLPNTETIIKQYTRGNTIFSAPVKVSALWRFIVCKQFEIRNKASYEHVGSGGDPTTLASLIAEATKNQHQELLDINSTLNQVLGDLMKIRIDLDRACSPLRFTD